MANKICPNIYQSLANWKISLNLVGKFHMQIYLGIWASGHMVSS